MPRDIPAGREHGLWPPHSLASGGPSLSAPSLKAHQAGFGSKWFHGANRQLEGFLDYFRVCQEGLWGSQHCLSQKGLGLAQLPTAAEGLILAFRLTLPQRQRGSPWEWASRPKPVGPLVLVLMWQRPLINEAEAGNENFIPAWLCPLQPAPPPLSSPS